MAKPHTMLTTFRAAAHGLKVTLTDATTYVSGGGLLGTLTIAQVNQCIAALVGLATLGYTVHRWYLLAKNKNDSKE
mgnify:FL=1